ncbi:bifunctional cytidylate kinase/GTPase Der [Kribbia dieselivorans]|uniref:bifunctional cytidylate kinase/GTPase Der n=1 Tax=Kribbia dieselivorans TaxID=331526 RepID=UPI000837DB0A|nr:bifunctional cytidylate kinase/GTPase Der [Kribbia dieselivorans]
MSTPIVVAIDGPSGSGKSTVSKAVAEHLAGGYLDTGAMYRALTWWCREQGIDAADHEAVAQAARTFPLELGTDPTQPHVHVGDTDITQAIRTPEISQTVSAIATNTLMRPVLQQRQRDLIASIAAERGAVVAEGRDITTVVAPDADVRILLTADEDARLRRRALEVRGEADEQSIEATRTEVVERDAQDSAVSEFRMAADGVITIDTSSLSLEESIAAVQQAVSEVVAERGSDEVDMSGWAAPDDEQAVALEQALRTGLEEFDLSDEDRALLEAEIGLKDEVWEGPLPVVAVVGRPNVGKSTLVNRILRRREAVVEDVPGVTRDRVSYDAEWAGRRFTLVDTGGWALDATGIHLRVAEQAEIAVDLADVVLFVVDARVGATDDDEAVVKLLRRSGKPVVLAANKVDDQRFEADAYALWNLGLGEPFPVSALHGRGTGDALDAVLDVLPEVAQHTPGKGSGDGLRRVALIGRPNVGKSSLLNKLAGEDRVVVDNVAGTTRDPVDEIIELGGKQWRFVDTAGIRRRVHQTRGADFYASLRTQTALEKAEVAVVLIDADEAIAEQDLRVISQVVDTGRALVIAYNKWDLLDEERRYYLEREIERELVQVQWAPRVNISAQTGRNVQKLVPALETALDSWDRRIPTSRLNAFLGEIVAAHPHPVRGGKQPRILFGTQASTRPPRFVIFASGFLEAGYRRFIERRLREAFGFEGSPIEISVRVREKRSRR